MQRIPRFILVIVLTAILLPVSIASPQDDTCTVSASNDVNKRAGPGTTFDRSGVLPAGTTTNVRYQTTGADGYTWWQLADESWVRADVVTAQGNCAAVPQMGQDSPPAATCDGGPNDVLAAAQAAYEAEELETAFERALSAQTICKDAEQYPAYMNAVFLARDIAEQQHPEWFTVRIADYSEHSLCSVFFEDETITWGTDVTWLRPDDVPLENGETARWKLPSGTYDIRLINCQAQQVGEAKGVIVNQSKTFTFGTPDSQGWVCDGSAQDIVTAAIAHYQNGEFEEADELATLAEQICTDTQRRNQLGALRWYLDQQLHPEWPTVRIISVFQQPVCGLAFGNMNPEHTLPIPSALGNNQLEMLQSFSFRAGPGTYAIAVFDCASQKVAEANDIVVEGDITLSIGPDGVQVVTIFDSGIPPGAVATVTPAPTSTPTPTATPGSSVTLAPNGKSVTLTIENLLDIPICYIAARATVSDGWHRLPIQVAPGASFQIEVTKPDAYAIALADCNQAVLKLFGPVYLTESGKLTARVNPLSPGPIDMTLDDLDQMDSGMGGMLAPGTSSGMPFALPDQAAVPMEAYQPADVQHAQELAQQGMALYQAGDYVAALAALEEALPIVTQMIPNGEGPIYLGMGLIYQAQGQLNRALEYYLSALPILRRADDKNSEAVTLYRIGWVYHDQGQYEQAIEYFDLYLMLQEQLTSSVEFKTMQVDVLGRLADSHKCLQHYTEALDYYTRAVGIARDIGERNLEGLLLGNIGEIHAKRNQHDLALNYLSQALVIMREVGNREQEAAILIVMGVSYEQITQYGQALAHFAQALSIYRENGDRMSEGVVLNNMGTVYSSQARYALALQFFVQALAIRREVGDLTGEASTLNNIGVIYDKQGQLDQALPYYTQALLIVQRIGDKDQEAVLLSNIGTVYGTQGQYTQAMEYFDQALVIVLEIGDRKSEGEILGNIGKMYEEQAQYAQALDYYNRALEIARGVGDLDSEANLLTSTGWVHVAQQDYLSATTYFTLALGIQRTIGDPAGEIQSLMYRGVVYEWLYQPMAAIRDYRDAIALIDTLISEAVLDKAIIGLSAQLQHTWPYQRLAVMLTQQGDYVPALDYAERGRAVLVRTDLSTDAIDFRAGVDEDLLLTERDLRLALDSAQRSLDSLRKDTSATNTDVLTAEETRDSARSSYEQHLSLMQLQGGFLAREIVREAASLEQIQAALPADTTLVLYAVGYIDSVAFLVTADRLAAITLDVNSDTIGKQVTAFSADRRANTDALRELYDLVLAPIADQITTSHLIIVPDGALNYVPFAALQAPDGSYLIDHYSISMVSSGTTLVLLNDRAQQTQVEPTSPALVLAQPAAPGLATLRNAPLEALDVANLLGTEPNLNATEADLRANAPGSAVLYITAHAELDRFAPLFSVIHLGEGGDYDGRLEVREIYELDLTQGTELVVLSGCETASGGDGEDFGLLTRAFFAAGAPRVVASLWSVDDAATADLMTAYIAERANYDNDADALRAAMLVMREQYPEPYYWASFVLSGLP